MRPTRPSLAWLALALLPVAGACGPPSPPVPKVDACKLFLLEDANAIAGVPMVATYGSILANAEKDDPWECVYASKGKENPRRLGLLVQPFATREEAVRIFELTTGQLEGFAGRPPQEVPGLADRALWAGGQLNKLFLLRGRFRLVVGAMATDNDSSLAAAKEVATRALARLPG